MTVKKTIIYSGVMPHGDLEVLSVTDEVLFDDREREPLHGVAYNSMSNPHHTWGGWVLDGERDPTLVELLASLGSSPVRF